MPACPKCGANVEATARFCATCGSPLAPAAAAAPAGPAVYPVAPGYPYYPMPPKRNNTVLIIVIVVVLVVAVPTVLAAVLYVMVSGLLPPQGNLKPVVTFAPPVVVTGGGQITLAGVSSAWSPSNFKVNLGAGASWGTSVNAPLGSGPLYRAYIGIGFDTYGVEWTDIGGEGTVSAGDYYLISIVNGTWPAGVTMTFYLLWSDGASLASASWTTPSSSNPVITFASPYPVSSGESFVVAGASQAVAPANYKVNMQINSTPGSAIAMPTTSGGSVSITVAGYTGTFSVTWTDIGGERTLNGGDSFTVTRTGGLPAASSYTFYLLWSDGSQITSTTWQTA